jgi:hypothetical protein
MDAETNRIDSVTYQSASVNTESKCLSASSTSSDTQRTIRTSRQTGDVSVRVTTRAVSHNNQTNV